MRAAAKLAAVAPAPLRCAVYTRKSSDEGLEQSFNSLHAQRDACEAYVRSQVGEGWTTLPQAYDDGGISGGTMERPGLKRLLADIASGLVDVVVTSMGRLTLNVLLSFAQFEREVTGERIRDKIALSKAKGMWMGSVPPLGYDRGDHVLVPNEAEAETVRRIFRRYLDVGSVHVLCAELERDGVRSKRHVTETGKVLGDAVLSRGALFHLLQNRHYLGEVVHKDQTHPGLHPGIVDAKLFEAVQKRLAKNRVTRARGSVKVAGALLTGRVFDGDGRRFSPTFSTGRSGRIHRYYVLTDIQLGREGAERTDAVRRVGAAALEALVLAELRRLSDRPQLCGSDIPALLRRVELRPDSTHLVLETVALFGDDHPELALEDLRGRLRDGERLVAEACGTALRLALPRRMQLRGGRTWMLAEAAPAARPAADPTLVDGLRRAHALALCDQTARHSPYERALRRLAFLAPATQRAILEGRHPPGLTLTKLLRAEAPLSWREHAGWLKRVAEAA